MHSVIYTLLGASLVAIGVIANGVADRIRGLRFDRDSIVGRPLRITTTASSRLPDASTPANGMKHDVVAALVGAGYRKAIAERAVGSCTARDRESLESWTAAALRHCAQGGVA